jgi:regulator of sigma E protease
MVASGIYLILALLGLGLLVFVHELGHYWMARRVGMKVESFGIGFGTPIFSFIRAGVRWNICWLPFGGYCKIAGMEKDKDGRDPEDIPGGFFAKTPWQRMKVSFAGPAANLIFAFVVFSLIWASGGREKSFAEVTKRIGWVDPSSEMYKRGVRPGDEILSYNGEPVTSFKDQLRAAMTGGDILHVEGRHWDENTFNFVPFSFDIKPYLPQGTPQGGMMTTGVLAPASYIIYGRTLNGSPNNLPKGSPLEKSTIALGDRIVACDGEEIFSLAELTSILNDGRALLTIRRGHEFLLRRVPRIPLSELKLDSEHREELQDWQWEGHLKTHKFQTLSFIPYNLSSDLVIEGTLPFIDQEKEGMAFPATPFSEKEEALRKGDEIVACDGAPVYSPDQLLRALQERRVHLIVQGEEAKKDSSWKEADDIFTNSVNYKELHEIIQSIGTPDLVVQRGSLRLLRPIIPKSRLELFELQNKGVQFTSELEEERKAIEAIDDVSRRTQALKFLEQHQKQLLLGLPGVQDLTVTYNPNPFLMFGEIVDEVVQTLSAVVGGYLNPKWLAGPIGIVQVIHHHWALGLKEAFFWIAIISLNLGLLNLLPLPIIDGGYILLSAFEIATGQRVKTKTIEKIVVPFAILLILFFIYLTYNDILRILTQFFRW